MKKKPNDLPAMRKKAEEKIRKQEGRLKDLSALDIQRLVHELGTYQIELEMQNEELRRAQTELETFRNRYADLYDFATVSYFTFDKNGLILEANLTGAGLLGIERRHLIKKPFSIFIGKDYQDLFYLHCKKVFDASDRQTCEIKLKKKDGTEFYAQMESIQVEDSQGNKSCRTSVIDITGLNRVDDSIETSHNLLVSLLNAVPDLLIVIDRNFRIFYSNFKRHDLIKPLNAEMDKTCYGRFKHLDAPCDDCSALPVFETGCIVEREMINLADGRMKEVRAFPIRNKAGEIVLVVEYVRDITERKRAEELLQQSEERYRLITESITDYIYTVRLEAGRLVETNHSDKCIAVTGYTSQEFAADPYLWIRMVVTEDHDLVRKQIEQVISGHHIDPIEHRIIRKDGALRWVESALIPCRDTYGNLVSYYGIIRDITEHKNLERELIIIEDRERRRIGHDLHDGLGQLLTGLAFKIRSLGRKLEQGHFEGVDEAAELSVLIDQAKEQVSDLSRGLSPLVIDQEGLTITLNALCYYTKKTFGIPCYFMCKEPVMVNNETAVTQLYRIAQEAVTNAAKHATPDRIDISLRKDHDKIIITVKDDGTGIPENLDNSGGMGLKIMKYRADLINASLDIRRDIGGGTIVTCAYSDVYGKKDRPLY